MTLISVWSYTQYLNIASSRRCNRGREPEYAFRHYVQYNQLQLTLSCLLSRKGVYKKSENLRSNTFGLLTTLIQLSLTWNIQVKFIDEHSFRVDNQTTVVHAGKYDDKIRIKPGIEINTTTCNRILGIMEV